MEKGDEPNEPSAPTMEPTEFVEMKLYEVWNGKYSEWCCFESEENAERKEGERENACSIARGPPCLLNVVIRLEGSGQGRVDVDGPTPEMEPIILWSDVIGPEESQAKGGDGEYG
jgi:hypothetical protein